MRQYTHQVNTQVMNPFCGAVISVFTKGTMLAYSRGVSIFSN